MDLHKVEITDTAYGGYGVGRTAEGKVVFVPYTVEGDVAEIINLEDKGKFAYAQLVELKKESPHRVEPHCKYHGECGGCHFGHISQSHQIEIKKRFISQSLRKYPRPLPNIEITSDGRPDYRIRTTFRVYNGKIGFFKSRTNEFIPVDSCTIVNTKLFEKAKKFASKYPNYPMFSLSVISNEKGETIAYIEGSKVPPLSSPAPFDGIKVNKEPFIGLSYLLFDFDGAKVAVDYGGFFQSNGYLNNHFRTLATSLVKKDSSVIELYAGSGFFTSALMKKTHSVQAVEINKMAAALGRHYGYPIASGDAFALLEEVHLMDTLFLDPPREGIEKQIMNHILRYTPKNIVYVSCNPTTLGRDIIRISEKYAMTKIHMVDMFPYTYHVETVVSLRLLSK